MDSDNTALQIKNMNRKKGAGTGFVVGGTLAMLATTAFQAVYPTFSTRNDAISFLGGAGVPTAPFWNSAIVIAGLLWLLSTYRLFHESKRRFSSLPFYLAGIGFLLVGLSPWDQYPLTHYMGANFVFLFGALSSLVAWKSAKGPMSGISLAAGILSFFAYFGGYIGLGNLFGSGGVERLIFYPIMLWEIAFGGYLLGIEGKINEQ